VSFEEARDAAQSSNGARKRILIADDHEMLRHGVRTLLEMRTDWEICGEAVNGSEAVEKAQELRPDLIILDINMPELNGLEAARRILHNDSAAKILVFTVHDSDQATQEVLAAGAHAYLSKSRAGQDLLRTVQELLEDAPPVIAARATSGA
jgi:DNA-binding NarL/FixJ family response regulator